MEGMAERKGEWATEAPTVELYCPTCRKTLYVEETESGHGCPVCSSPLVAPLTSYIDLRFDEPAIVLV